MTRRLRVLQVIQNLNYGGMERVLSDIVQHVDKRFECHVLTLQYIGRFGQEAGRGATLHQGPPMSRFSLLRPKALATAMRRIAPDVVHTHSGVWYKAARAARMAGVPRVVHTEHGRQSEAWLARLLDRRAARITDGIVPVSQPLRDYLTGRLAVPASRLHVVRNGIDVAAFRGDGSRADLATELGLAAGVRVVGSIGRLEPVKGYDNVIRAFAAARGSLERSGPVALVVAGEGSERPALERLIGELGVGDCVRLLGWRDDPQRLLGSFDVFIMGSWSEGTSISLLEAMAAGCPPVVTAVGGNLDVLGPELAGQAVPAGDTAALAGLLVATLESGRQATLSAQAQARVEREFSLAAMIAAYERIYSGG